MSPAPQARADTAPASGAQAIRLPQRQILTDDVYEAIKAQIMDHAIAPGERMSIESLARELQVSQTPIREALARLESDGLVTKAPLRGYSATPLLTADEMDDLYVLRSLVEPWTAARAAERITDEGRARLEAEIRSCPEAPAGSDYHAYRLITAHDARFHDLIAELAGNGQVRAALGRTHAHLHLFRLAYAANQGSEALREHREIARAIGAGSPGEAEQAMRRHLEIARERLRRDISA
jgi:DNA-binding GntR family transcriptional regulator